jgi:hypothetical protein
MLWVNGSVHTKQVDSSDDAFSLYSGGVLYKCQLECQISGIMFMVFVSPSWKII